MENLVKFCLVCGVRIEKPYKLSKLSFMQVYYCSTICSNIGRHDACIQRELEGQLKQVEEYKELRRRKALIRRDPVAYADYLLTQVIITPVGCMEWIGACDFAGYGLFTYNGVVCQVTRFVYKYLIGSIPEKFMICHTCDNPSCVNPAHLFLGTNQENVQDASRKGRLHRPKGELNPAHILTTEQVTFVRSRRFSLKELGLIAESYGMSQESLRKIAGGRGWADVPRYDGKEIYVKVKSKPC